MQTDRFEFQLSDGLERRFLKAELRQVLGKNDSLFDAAGFADEESHAHGNAFAVAERARLLRISCRLLVQNPILKAAGASRGKRSVAVVAKCAVAR